MTLWSCGLARSRDKLQLLYLYYYSAYDHQTWHYGDYFWGSPSHNVTRPFGQVVLQGHVINWISYISTTTRPTTIKLGKVVSYYKGLLYIELHKPLKHEVTWGHVTDQMCYISTTTRPLAIKCDKMMAYNRGFLPWSHTTL